MGRKGDGSTLARVRAVSRALAVLRSFKRSEPNLLLRTIAERTELDMATTRRLLVTLADEGLVAHDPETSRYRLTTGLLLLASAVDGGLSLQEIARDHLVELAAATDTTVFLSAFIDGRMVCIDKVQGASPVDIKWWSVNESLPMNCGAAPKLILAYLPDEQFEDIAQPESFIALSPHSVMDLSVLKDQLRQARDRGWMLSENDVSDGLSALAAPVFGKDGTLVAAVSIGGLTPQISEGVPPKLLAPLLNCAGILTESCQAQEETLPLTRHDISLLEI